MPSAGPQSRSDSIHRFRNPVSSVKADFFQAVGIDFIFKEQRPDRIGPVPELINRELPHGAVRLTRDTITTYYRADKRIWQIFLAFRKLDRFITTRLMNQRYDFILPGNITR
jgi:hypothetical protein